MRYLENKLVAFSLGPTLSHRILKELLSRSIEDCPHETHNESYSPCRLEIGVSSLRQRTTL